MDQPRQLLCCQVVVTTPGNPVHELHGEEDTALIFYEAKQSISQITLIGGLSGTSRVQPPADKSDRVLDNHIGGGIRWTVAQTRSRLRISHGYMI